MADIETQRRTLASAQAVMKPTHLPDVPLAGDVPVLLQPGEEVIPADPQSQGGRVPDAPGSDPNEDSVPMTLKAGDFVVPKDQAEQMRGRLPETMGEAIDRAADPYSAALYDASIVKPTIEHSFLEKREEDGIYWDRYDVIARHPETADIIGSSIFTEREDGKLYPEGVGVHEEYRRQGVATAMYQHMESLGYSIQNGDQLPDGKKFRKAFNAKGTDRTHMKAGGVVPGEAGQLPTTPAAAISNAVSFRSTDDESARMQAMFAAKMAKENRGLPSSPALTEAMTKAAEQEQAAKEQEAEARQRRFDAGLTFGLDRPQAQPLPGGDPLVVYGHSPDQAEARQREMGEERQTQEAKPEQEPAAQPAQSETNQPKRFQGGASLPFFEQLSEHRRELGGIGPAMLGQLLGRETQAGAKARGGRLVEAEWGRNFASDLMRTFDPAGAELMGLNQEFRADDKEGEGSRQRTRPRLPTTEMGEEFAGNTANGSQANRQGDGELTSAIRELTLAVKKLTEATERQSRGGKTPATGGGQSIGNMAADGVRGTFDLLKRAVANSGNSMMGRVGGSEVGRSGPATIGGPAEGAGAVAGQATASANAGAAAAPIAEAALAAAS